MTWADVPAGSEIPTQHWSLQGPSHCGLVHSSAWQGQSGRCLPSPALERVPLVACSADTLVSIAAVAVARGELPGEQEAVAQDGPLRHRDEDDDLLPEVVVGPSLGQRQPADQQQEQQQGQEQRASKGPRAWGAELVHSSLPAFLETPWGSHGAALISPRALFPNALAGDASTHRSF